VGANNGFASSVELIDIVRSMMTQEAIPPDHLEELAIRSRARVATLVQKQLFAMFFEAMCGMITFKGDVYYQNPESPSRSFLMFENPIEALIACARGLE